MWEYPGTSVELLQDWRRGYAPLKLYELVKTRRSKSSQGVLIRYGPLHISGDYPVLGQPMFRGSITLIDIDLLNMNSIQKLEDSCDAQAHIHMDDDTFLEINGIQYPGYPERKTI